MAKKIRPYPAETVPDPARSYERARPEAEAGMGRLDADPVTPVKRPDQMHMAVSHRQKSRQINTDEVMNAGGGSLPQEDTPVFQPPKKPRQAQPVEKKLRGTRRK